MRIGPRTKCPGPFIAPGSCTSSAGELVPPGTLVRVKVTTASRCDPGYPTLRVPPLAENVYNCADISPSNFTVLWLQFGDPEGFDSDHDGASCES